MNTLISSLTCLYFHSWYHGRLSREQSEERLKQSNKPGGFLLRESERKTGSFVLSYLSLKLNVNHFK